jgi:hypothetical protein
MLRQIFGGVTESWKKLHDDLRGFTLPQVLLGRSNQDEMSWTGHVGNVGEMRNTYKVLVMKSEKYRPLGIPGRS